MQSRVKMDQSIENFTNFLEEVPDETPSAVNDVQVKSESADLPKEPEEDSLDGPDLEDSDDDAQSGDDESSANAEGSSGEDFEATPGNSDNDSEWSPQKTKMGPSSKPSKQRQKEKPSTSSSLNATVKSLMKCDILSANGNENDMQQFAPVSTLRNKAEALAEEVAKLSIDDQPQAKKDAAALIEASKKFDPSAKIFDMNWKVEGLKTLLKHHQLKAAAWMFNRERSEVEPNGGLLCDEMGLGKQISSRRKAPTLIIVPRSLVTQWLEQIKLHCAEKISKDVLEHYAGARTGQRDVAKVMRKTLIVITTYEEVCGSHPKLKPPVTLKSPEEIEAWKEKEYKRRAGPFHKVDWHRIILDEAHAIKNKDCATSIAVRALRGKFKWAVSGTPLHNGVEELYPYLHFIFTSERMEYETFLKKYSNGLDKVLETVLHRSTYSTRILGKPIVTLPGINNRVVEVELCQAEKLLYREIQDLGIAMINGLAGTKQKQSKCIFAVITILRMFVSHPLLAEKTLEAVLDQRVIGELKAMAEAEGVAETPSGIIIDLILAVGDKVPSRPRPPGDFPKLLELFHNHLMHIRQQDGMFEKFLRMNCPRCENLVTEEEPFVVTSCLHVYCKGCFDELPGQDGKTDTITYVCTSCKTSIEEAGYSDDSPKDSPKKGSPKKSSPKKRKQSKPKEKGKNVFKKRPQKSFKKQVLLRDPSDDEWDEPSEDEGDWISRIGDRMPSAKTTAVRDIVTSWVKDDEEVKIVIFVQFLKTVQLLQLMCEKEGWKYTVITGKVSPISRDERIEQFSKEKDIKVMISSLRTGGVGLNLTMANKCILVDPWWNEAIQDQAYCRLYRIGQPRPVEYVQLVAKVSIDLWMMSLQDEKTRNIHQLFSKEALKEILGVSEDVSEEPNGGFLIPAGKGNKHTQSWRQAVESGVLDEVDPSEED
ncbi:hypothetical protein N7519_006264 [Penicillium mononematosum]|uniref:uncharacterized protein n=1 Tax=Penicillium mononematosum TaxID=268346 RepID=UPI00254744AD|nr:uncharacterized protein N7519_006264 [Penicillium mononematosum]KAJ6184963.1 hypothetical protein N7519_006264 [Penicillium mononematosum]